MTVIPSDAASAFILTTKAATLPASHTARVYARLLADWVSIPSSSWRSVSCSPRATSTVDSSLWASLAYSATSAGPMVTVGPGAPAATGWSRSTTTAVVILVSDATGTETSGPDEAANPSAGTSTAAWPFDGQGREGVVPGTARVEARDAWSTGLGSGRSIRRTARSVTPAATSRATTTIVTSSHLDRRRRCRLRVGRSGCGSGSGHTVT